MTIQAGVSVLLLLIALGLCVAALVKNSIQYCCVSLLLVIVDLMVQFLPKG